MRAFADMVRDLERGNQACLDEMMPVVYAELRRMAGYYMSAERPDHTLQPTALVHEAYLRLVGQESVDWGNRAQVLGLAARMMRRVLIDHAAGHNALKRAGQRARVQLQEGLAASGPFEIDFLDLDRALNALAELSPKQAAIVELRFFGGLGFREVAEVLGDCSMHQVYREWMVARLFLLRQLTEGSGE